MPRTFSQLQPSLWLLQNFLTYLLPVLHDAPRCAWRCLSSSRSRLISSAVAPISDCQTYWYIVATFCMLAMSSNNLLFFIRVRAVYGNSPSVTAFFGLLWLLVLSSTVWAPWAIQFSVCHSILSWLWRAFLMALIAHRADTKVY